MFIEICFIFIPAIKLIPLVISKIPVNKELAMLEGIFNFWHIGLNKIEIMLVILLVFSIEIITEKSTTNPPIKRVVEIADVILSPKISPRLEIEIFCNLFSDAEALCIVLLLVFIFQNLNKNPTVKQPKICVKSSKKPISELPNKPIPTVPTMKSGPELFVKLISLSHSSLEHNPLFLKFTAILAPTGYPT